MLVVDCLRADRVGAAKPYHRAVAPQLEAFASSGVRFTRAFAQASWTRPSVPTLLTGLYPSEHGLGAFLEEGDQVTGGTLSPAAVTIAEAMRALGYATALFAQQNQLAPKFGLDQGFDVYDHKASRAQHIHEELLQWLDVSPRPRRPPRPNVRSSPTCTTSSCTGPTARRPRPAAPSPPATRGARCAPTGAACATRSAPAR